MEKLEEVALRRFGIKPLNKLEKPPLGLVGWIKF
jgi:hypothetical protein